MPRRTWFGRWKRYGEASRARSVGCTSVVRLRPVHTVRVIGRVVRLC